MTAGPSAGAGRPTRSVVSLAFGADGSGIRVAGARITIGDVFGQGTPPRASGTDVELAEIVWLTRAEEAVLRSWPIDAGSGLGVILLPLLRHAAVVLPSSGHDRVHLAIMIRGMLSAAAASSPVVAAAAAAAERCVDTTGIDPLQVLVVRAMQIIHSQLATRSLTSASVADQLGISVRALQVAFRGSSASPAQVIRALRLERALLEVQSEPALSPLFLAAVAGRWGFSSRFSLLRALLREYGTLQLPAMSE